METQGYLCDIHTKKMGTHIYDIHTKILETHRIFVTFTQRNVGELHSEKEAKMCGSLHKIRLMYEIKGNKEVCS